MDPFTIAATVTKITTTCLTTGKAIYDLSCKYQDAPRNMVAISAEVAVISASLSQIQALVLSKQNPEQLLRSRPEVAATLDTSLTGCMVLFSCLDEEIREVSRHARGLDKLSWLGKVKTVWKQEKFQELLDGIRGQQLAINTLIQLLQMDSLNEITQLLQRNAPELKKTVERTNTLRRSHPLIRVAESIYSQEDRASVYSKADSILASSDLEFDFDDIIVNSAAYRRALAAARQQTSAPRQQTEEPDQDLIDFSENDTLRQFQVADQDAGVKAISDDLLGLRFSVIIDEPTSEAAGNFDFPLDVSESRTPEPQPVLPSHIPTEASIRSGLAATHSSLINIPNRVLSDRPRSVDASAEKLDVKPSGTPEVNSSPRGTRSPTPSIPAEATSRPQRTCRKCNEVLSGQFVRALGATFHLECFTCQDCGKIVATKFFPVPGDGSQQHPLCERDYFRRLDLLCYSCGESLRGSYVTALDRKYHTDHFGCGYESCITLFGSSDSYYEHDGGIYCLVHYASAFAKICKGCTLPVLKQFVEIFRDGQNQHWHPECYMIHKYWNCTMSNIVPIRKVGSFWTDMDGQKLDIVALSQRIASIEDTISRTWSILSTFEEKAAATISELFVASPKSDDAQLAIQRISLVLSSVGFLFAVLESVNERRLRTSLAGVAFSRESKLLCKKIVALMQDVVESHKSTSPPNGVTQKFMSLVTGVAYNLKLLIRIALSGSSDSPNELMEPFLRDMSVMDVNRDLRYYRSRISSMVSTSNDLCVGCRTAVEAACFKAKNEPIRLWHQQCLPCPRCHRSQAFGTFPHIPGSPAPVTLTLVCNFCKTGLDRNTTIVPQTRLFVHLLWTVLARAMLTVGCDFAALLDVQRVDLGEKAAGAGAAPQLHDGAQQVSA
ncbi:hypothetical protein BAUCODRAFT_33682 [Baudoinia panamericana UAMH 10762]|uniref:LIM zinc-binding domain-containing protein n=1 Tax=Baudoinia panamericana (strain UAMH 10762) TaxID=717646 RepID=M2NBS9_BAUPA|nr:uncharacterized protein BAUCODRAFT_33682 [Baudoinia panamericana UAMH 10762]EMC96355.1 hypothetical protein BAUCODRAFT_33682 [Baudoinia panamericana UAMH 10762]